MRKCKRGLSFALIVLLLSAVLLGLVACGNAPVTRSYFAMDTVMEVRYYGDEKYLFDCGSILSDLDDKLSATKTSSPIYKLNEQNVKITDEEILSLIATAKELAELTEGAFDPTVYPLVKAWGFLTDEADVPSESAKEEALSKIGYDKIDVTDGIENVQIDLGAIAKGYATDKLKAFLQEKGIKDGLLNLGGNIYAMGKKNGENWKVAIKNPVGDGYVGVLTLSNKAVVTSGLYERFFEKDGKKYGHILDPFSGNTVENEFLSVSIIGENATKCDALSTAVFVMGKEKAIQFLRENQIDAVLLTKEDGIFITEGIDPLFSLSGTYVSHFKTVISW